MDLLILDRYDRYTHALETNKPIFYYGLDEDNDIIAKDVEYTTKGTSFDVFVEDNYYGLFVNEPNATTLRFSKSDSLTRYPYSGTPLVITATFSGSYTKNESNIITSINCSCTLSHNNNYNTTITRTDFYKGSTGSTKFTPTVRFNVDAVYPGSYNHVTYDNLGLYVNIP